MSGVSKDAALRIALAAKSLPDSVEVRDLLLGLLSLVGEPITTAKLGKVRLGKLKSLDALAEVDESDLKAALNFLKGRNIERAPDPLPAVSPLSEGEMPESIRVACSSNNGDLIDGHFGSCSRFLIYQLSSSEIRLVDIRVPRAVEEDEDKNAIRAHLLSDCQVLYTVSVGGPAAAKVVREGLHPIKMPQGGAAPAVLDRLRQTLETSPPPWLAKAMGRGAEERLRYRDEEIYG